MLSILRTPVRKLAIMAAAVGAIASCDGLTEPQPATPGDPVAAKVTATPTEGTAPYRVALRGEISGDSIKAAAFTWKDQTISLPASTGAKDTALILSSPDSGYVKLKVTNMRDSSAIDSVYVKATDANPTVKLTLADSVVDVGDSLLVTLEGKDNLPQITLSTVHPFGLHLIESPDSTGTLQSYLKPTDAVSGFVKGIVADAHGHTTSDSLPFRSRFQPPALALSASGTTDTIPHKVTFSLSAKDKVGAEKILADFGDGTTEEYALSSTKDTSFTKQHTYTSPGTRTARFTLVNKAGLVAAQEAAVTSNPGQTPLPTVTAALTNKQDTIPHVVNASVHMTHRDRLDSLVVSWSNGTTSYPLSSSDTILALSRTYNTVGKHPITFTAYRAGVSAATQDTVETKPYPPAVVTAANLSVDAVVNEGAAARSTWRLTSDRNLGYAFVFVNDTRVDSVGLAGKTQDITVERILAPGTTSTIGVKAFDATHVASNTATGITYVDKKPVITARSWVQNQAVYPNSLTLSLTVDNEAGQAVTCSGTSSQGKSANGSTTLAFPINNPSALQDSEQVRAIVTCTDERSQASLPDTSSYATALHAHLIRLQTRLAHNNALVERAINAGGTAYQTTNGEKEIFFRGSELEIYDVNTRWLSYTRNGCAISATGQTTNIKITPTDSMLINLRVVPDEAAYRALLVDVSRATRNDSVNISVGSFSCATDIDASKPGIQIRGERNTNAMAPKKFIEDELIAANAKLSQLRAYSPDSNFVELVYPLDRSNNAVRRELTFNTGFRGFGQATPVAPGSYNFALSITVPGDSIPEMASEWAEAAIMKSTVFGGVWFNERTIASIFTNLIAPGRNFSDFAKQAYAVAQSFPQGYLFYVK